MAKETTWMRCPLCGNIQANTGEDTECEECGAALKVPDNEAKKHEKEGGENSEL